MEARTGRDLSGAVSRCPFVFRIAEDPAIAALALLKNLSSAGVGMFCRILEA